MRTRLPSRRVTVIAASTIAVLAIGGTAVALSTADDGSPQVTSLASSDGPILTMPTARPLPILEATPAAAEPDGDPEPEDGPVREPLPVPPCPTPEVRPAEPVPARPLPGPDAEPAPPYRIHGEVPAEPAPRAPEARHPDVTPLPTPERRAEPAPAWRAPEPVESTDCHN